MNKIHNLVNMNIVNRMLLSLAMFCCCLNGVKATPLLQDIYQMNTDFIRWELLVATAT